MPLLDPPPSLPRADILDAASRSHRVPRPTVHVAAGALPVGGRTPLAPTTAAALLALAAVKVHLARTLDMPPMYVLGAIAAVLAVATARRMRGAAAAGTAYAVAVLGLTLQFILPDLAHPETPTFGPSLLIAATGVIATVAGVATVREERRRRRHGDVSVLRTPGWLVPLVASVVAASAGAIAVSGVVRAGDVRADGERTGLSPRTLAALPSVVAEHHAFAQRELHARAGQPVVLRVDNRDGVRHSFDVDAFDVHVSLPGRASTLVVFMAGRAGRYTVYCAPHFDRASGRGMRTTLVVAP